MSELAERFDAFFRAANGAGPYPWQTALVERVAADGHWPPAISAPTGAGKSSVVDVHVFLVAEHAAERIAVRPPRRLVLVAPRRVLVDDQFERAMALAGKLAASAGGLTEWADPLRTLVSARRDDDPTQPDEEPLLVTRLRGGAIVDTRWRVDPSRCQIVCTTPQMWGSRLLLRGYRSTARARNLETGLLCHDTVVVIDEAHLHERLVETARRVTRLDDGPGALQLVAMSATRQADDAHGLTDTDFEHPELRRRVRASKTVVVESVEDWRRELVPTLVARAREYRGAGTVGVFVNTVAQALTVASELGRESANVQVMCGRMRPADLARVREEHEGLLDSRGDPSVDFLIGTQSVEVGIDLDLPVIVTAAARASALAQRAGRLNRSGGLDGSVLHVVAPGDPAAVSEAAARPYTPDELAQAADWLARLGPDASPECVAATELPPLESRPLPQLGAVDLETLAMTSDGLSAEPDVSLYIDEPIDSLGREFQVGGRDHLGHSAEVVGASLGAAPPRRHELATVTERALRELIAALDGRTDAERPLAWRLRRTDGDLDVTPFSAALLGVDGELRSDDVFIIDAEQRLLVHGAIGAVGGRAEREELGDVRDARPRLEDGAEADAVVPLEVSALEEALTLHPGLATRAARRALVAEVSAQGLDTLATRLRRPLRETEVTWCAPDDAETGLLVVRDLRRTGVLAAVTTDDRAVRLDDHQRDVERRMELVLERLDLPLGGPDRSELLDAARWHDEGKHHPHFQVRMGNDPGGDPVAKPVPGFRADRGDGWRHEQLSVAIAAVLGASILTAVLIGGHHGRGRPLFDRDGDALLAGWADKTDEVVAEVGRWFGPGGAYEHERREQQRRLGVHRLAFLEALLRCADIQVSREGR